MMVTQTSGETTGATAEWSVSKRRSRRLRQLLGSVAAYATLGMASIVCIAPIYAAAVTALKTTEEFKRTLGSVGLPEQLTISKFGEAWTDLGFSRMMSNTAILSVSTAIGVTALSSAAGFALARMEFPGRRILLVSTVSVMAIPAIVIIVPLFRLAVETGMLNRYPSAILAEIGIQLPFGVFLVYTFMRELPRDVFDAAAVDGISPTRLLLWIAIPMARPILLTVGLVTLIFSWNDLLIPLVLWQGEDLRVLMVGLAGLAPGRAGAVDIPLVMAAVWLSILPIIVLFALGRRIILRGLIRGNLR
jgi:raffinose/stachyose/melibiose transport system permease protein